KDLEWLAQQAKRLGAGVTLTPRRTGDAPTHATPLAIIAVQGPQARTRCWQIMPDARATAGELKPFHAVHHSDTRFGQIMIARTGYTGEDGHELILPADHAVALWDQLLDAGVRPAGLGARDTLRLEAGMKLYGQGMDESTSPLDCGLAWTEEDRKSVG